VTEVNIHEAKTHLSRLIEKVQHGEEVIIAKAGKPIAKLVKITPPAKRVLGSGIGTIQFTPGWDAPMTDEEVDEFFGK
jgi:prevent-host-death family protein